MRGFVCAVAYGTLVLCGSGCAMSPHFSGARWGFEFTQPAVILAPTSTVGVATPAVGTVPAPITPSFGFGVPAQIPCQPVIQQPPPAIYVPAQKMPSAAAVSAPAGIAPCPLCALRDRISILEKCSNVPPLGSPVGQ